MRAEERLFLFFKELLSGIDQAAHPGKPFLAAWSVCNTRERRSIWPRCGCVRLLIRPGDIGLQLIVGHSFTGDELGSSVGELDDDGRVDLGCGFQYGIDGIGADRIDSGSAN